MSSNFAANFEDILNSGLYNDFWDMPFELGYAAINMGEAEWDTMIQKVIGESMDEYYDYGMDWGGDLGADYDWASLYDDSVYLPDFSEGLIDTYYPSENYSYDPYVDGSEYSDWYGDMPLDTDISAMIDSSVELPDFALGLIDLPIYGDEAAAEAAIESYFESENMFSGVGSSYIDYFNTHTPEDITNIPWKDIVPPAAQKDAAQRVSSGSWGSPVSIGGGSGGSKASGSGSNASSSMSLTQMASMLKSLVTGQTTSSQTGYTQAQLAAMMAQKQSQTASKSSILPIVLIGGAILLALK
ncbi:hypothetical protein M0R72_17370 [Candidatus Pacearchaeota archaeon]|jgi:hypothetical protein|nr:hypothetical protein [Candidatus Pacearchaeota archaeon]